MKRSINTQTVQFTNGNRSWVIHPEHLAPMEQIVEALALPQPRGLVILNGGTAQLDPALQGQLGLALGQGLARLVAEDSLTVITGGTDAGIFHLFGQGLARWGCTAPCIGVAVGSLVTWPGKANGEAALEPHHSHFVLVDGQRWGDETETMYALAAALAVDCPSVAIFAGGGEIAIHEMLANVQQQRPMILLAGSGRAVDDVLAARRGQTSPAPRLSAIASRGRLLVHDLASSPASLQGLVRQVLAGSVTSDHI